METERPARWKRVHHPREAPSHPEVDAKPALRQGAEVGGSEDGNKTKGSRARVLLAAIGDASSLWFLATVVRRQYLWTRGWIGALPVTKTLPLPLSPPNQLFNSVKKPTGGFTST